MKRMRRKHSFFDSYRYVYSMFEYMMTSSLLSALFTCGSHIDCFRKACEQKFKNFCSISIIAWYVNSWLRESNTRFPDIFTTINCMNIFRIFLQKKCRPRIKHKESKNSFSYGSFLLRRCNGKIRTEQKILENADKNNMNPMDDYRLTAKV